MTTCTVNGCTGHAVARTLCKRHYDRWYRHPHIPLASPFRGWPHGMEFIERMPCPVVGSDREVAAALPTATEASNAAHLAAWWAADARIQAANDAIDALEMAAD